MAGVRRRTYSPTSPLLAREVLRFSGRPVATRETVPESYFTSARKRRQMWDVRKVDHVEDLPVKKAPPAPTALPAASVQPDTSTAGAEEREPAIVPMGAVISPGGEKRTIVIDGKPVELTAGPTINVATPEQQRQRNKRR